MNVQQLLHTGMYQLVPRIAARARSEGVLLTEASYTILIRVSYHTHTRSAMPCHALQLNYPTLSSFMYKPSHLQFYLTYPQLCTILHHMILSFNIH